MKITQVRAIPLSDPVPPARRHRTDLGTKVKSDATLIVVETDKGLTGIGAALGTPPVVAAIVEHELAAEVVGEDPMFSERIFEKMYNGSRSKPALERGVPQAETARRVGVIMEAIAGIDIAIWDVKAKALGVPVYQALGAVRDKVRAYASGGWAPGNEAETELGGYADRGYTACKMRVVGRDGFSIENCVRRVEAARHRPRRRTHGRRACIARNPGRHQHRQGARTLRHRLVRGAGVAGQSRRHGRGSSIDPHTHRLGRAGVLALWVQEHARAWRDRHRAAGCGARGRAHRDPTHRRAHGVVRCAARASRMGLRCAVRRQHPRRPLGFRLRPEALERFRYVDGPEYEF